MEKTEKKIKVVIGDEYRDAGICWADILKRSGMYAVVRRQNGKILFDTIAEERPDVVLVNMRLTDMPLFELILKVQELGSKTPFFIAVAEKDSQYTQMDALEHGADAFIRKPVNPEELVYKIKTFAFANNVSNYEKTCGCTNNLEYIVTMEMRKMRIPANVKGYYYIREALMLSITESDILDSVTKGLYPAIAERFNTTPSRVERAIRHAVDLTWESGDAFELVERFGSRSKKPTNSEFISLIADDIRVKNSTKKRLL